MPGARMTKVGLVPFICNSVGSPMAQHNIKLIGLGISGRAEMSP